MSGGGSEAEAAAVEAFIARWRLSEGAERAACLRVVSSLYHGIHELLAAKVHAGYALTAAEADIRDRGLVMILDEHHEAVDAAVATAYGWSADLDEEEVLARLVALNRQRAQEEAQGMVRWLRPDYQRPRFGTPARVGEQIDTLLPEPMSAAASKPLFPSEAVERVAAVLAALAGTRRRSTHGPSQCASVRASRWSAPYATS